MSVDELARAAAVDLRASIARQVSPAEGREQLRRRVRARRAEHAALTLGCIVALAVGTIVVTGSGGESSLPATAPTVDRNATPARDCLFSVSCTDGVYRAALTVPTTFATAGRLNVASDTASVLDLTEGSEVYGVTIVAQPSALSTVGGSGQYVADAAVEATSVGLASWLAGRSDLSVTTLVPVMLGGRPAIQFDVSAADDAVYSYTNGCSQCIPLFGIASRIGEPAIVHLLRGQAIRLTLLDVPGAGTVAVLVRDNSTNGYAPEVAVSQVRPVLASLAFGTD